MKKSSDTPQQLEFLRFFLDRNLGREKLAGLLREAGFVIQVHDDYYKRDEADNVWLEECGRKRLIVITPDTNILKVPLSMRAIGKNRGRVFFLSTSNVPSELWAKAITSAWREINTVLAKHQGPFYARISLAGLVWGVTELTPLGREKKKRTAK